ncbi:hypothetical protein ID866_4184 [Astraeus odoratus]|nr:hypothetical protein ID866_4184 [Astraeus odoratus]
MPLQVATHEIRHEIYVNRSPEDYASIFEWATYSWVYPLIKRGAMTEISEGDVWDLSPTMHSRAVFSKFSAIEQSTLFRRLVVANSHDLIFDILLTVVTVLLSYCSLYFLRRVLELIESPTLENRSRAYVMAFLLFLCSLSKGEADAQHLYFGRRASARVRIQLIDTIYEKALKRRNYSGIADKDTLAEAVDSTPVADLDDPAPGTDVGRVVNLMAIDANKISLLVGSAYLLYGGKSIDCPGCIYVYCRYGDAPFFKWVIIPFMGFEEFSESWQARVSLERIEAFLNEDEVSDRCYLLRRGCHTSGTHEAGDLAIEHGYFKWDKVPSNRETEPPQQNGRSPALLLNGGIDVGPRAMSPEDTKIPLKRFELRDISVSFPEGRLSVITGPTGSGKTALLSALLGEMSIIKGKLILCKVCSGTDRIHSVHPISYAAQTPWLQWRSIKENILFECPYDEDRYKDVVECCALEPDLDILEDGDETIVGDRGVSLSGGQRARVALARAVYAPTKYVLLDDPFSAVDSQTSRFLFQRLLCGPLLQGRTVILATHQVELVLPAASYLVHMMDGRINAQGSVNELQSRGLLGVIPRQPTQDPREQVVQPNKKPHMLDEPIESGGVKLSTYLAYFQASSYWVWIILTLLVIFSQSMGVVEKLWIRAWGHAYGDGLENAVSPAASPTLPGNGGALIEGSSVSDSPLYYIGIYAAIGFTTTCFSVAYASMQCFAALKASRSLFSRLLDRVVRATMHWHDTTPNGRILNRFSKDMDAIDTTLPNTLSTVSTSLVTFSVAIITVAVFFPAFLAPAIVIALLYYFVAKRYLSISRALRRMEAASRSPIFSGFGEVLDGVITIRAFAAERRLMEDFHKKVNVAVKMYYNSWMVNRWLLINFDALGAVAVFITTLLALSGAVERVVEYLDIPQEPPASIKENRPPAYWPSQSQPLVSVENLFVKYAPELPCVLQNITFSLNATEHIGIIGRTGSGKSTLVMSMLRFVEPFQGRIMIDGIDITTIGVSDLRSNVTYIPGDAVLFSGTLKHNIDPFEEHGDYECLDALRRVQLLDDDALSQSSLSSTSRPGSNSRTLSLYAEVAPGGANFSQGQRQLIAMARALLRRSNIIILDEATSSVDFDTDAKIQATLQEQFAQSLVITGKYICDAWTEQTD